MDQAPASPPVTLKKYGNRRLYDTSSSRYVTLGEVEAMVQGGRDIVVVDAKSGEDLTKEVMVQLILERDGARAALPVSLLKQVIKLANSPLKDGLMRAMQDGLDGFMSSQRAVVDAQRNLMAQMGAQMGQMGQMAQLSPWVQPPATPAAMWNPFPPPAPAGSPQQPQQPSQQQAQAQQQTTDFDTLKTELAETQLLVKRLLEREAAPKKASTSKKKKASTKKR